MTSPDVVIVGAGIVGAACAVRLAESGLRVTLLEADFAGGGSTGAAMGHVVVMDDSLPQRELCAWSRRRLREWLEWLPDDVEHDRCGTLWLAADEGELDIARQRAAGYRAGGVAADVVDEMTLRMLEPNLRPGLAGALHVPDDGVCYPPAIARGMVARAATLGATIVYATATSIGPERVALDDGSVLTPRHIVVAAGVGSRRLIPDLPIVPRKGHLVITDRHAGLVRHQLVELGYLRSAHTMGAASVAFNVQPRRNGQLLIGSSRELVGFDTSINRALVGVMLDRAIQMIPAASELRVWRTWTGFRPATLDSRPLIGEWLPMPGVWIAAGHEGLGITMAVGTADIIAAALTGAPPPVPAEAFNPCRAIPAAGLAA